jgi:hypothetical protein
VSELEAEQVERRRFIEENHQWFLERGVHTERHLIADYYDALPDYERDRYTQRRNTEDVVRSLREQFGFGPEEARPTG